MLISSRPEVCFHWAKATFGHVPAFKECGVEELSRPVACSVWIKTLPLQKALLNAVSGEFGDMKQPSQELELRRFRMITKLDHAVPGQWGCVQVPMHPDIGRLMEELGF